MGDARIRAVTDEAGCRDVERLQAAVWGMPPEDVIPYQQLLTAARWGGVVLVADDGADPIGFCYGFVGLDGGEPLLCSHMLGVLPAHRDRDLGRRLKLAQRDAALRHGLRRIVWTFDPLESRNAYLNLHKLRAVAREYHVDHYGPMRDELNRGLPSDRLVADWRLDVEGREPQAADDAPVVNPPRGGDPPAPGPLDAAVLGAELLGAEAVRVAVPGDVTVVKRTGADLAGAWRANVREAFQAAFATGYEAVDLVPPGETATATYLLTKGPSWSH